MNKNFQEFEGNVRQGQSDQATQKSDCSICIGDSIKRTYCYSLLETLALPSLSVQTHCKLQEGSVWMDFLMGLLCSLYAAWAHERTMQDL